MEQKKKYVVLEHLQLPNRGFRFWTINTGDNTHSHKGELWYKEVLFTDNSDEAIAMSRIANTSITPTHSELEEYWREEIKKEKQNVEPVEDHKEEIVESISHRIKEEQKKYEKHESMNWYEIAARKIYATFNIKPKIY